MMNVLCIVILNYNFLPTPKAKIMTIEVLVSDPVAKSFIQATFPHAASRRPLRVETATRYQVSDYWSEGSRNEAVFLELATMRAIPATSLPENARQQANNPFNLAIGEVQLLAGYAVVEHIIFCGKDLGFRLYLHPDNLAPLLAASNKDRVEVSEKEKSILEAMRSLKAGPYRNDALRNLNYTEDDKQSLATKGLVKIASNGAVSLTQKGRDASR